MDDLSIHELVGISRSYPDFLIPPKKRFAGRHSSEGCNRYTSYFG